MITGIKSVSPFGAVREYKGRFIFISSTSFEIYNERGGLLLAIVPFSWAVEYIRE